MKTLSCLLLLCTATVSWADNLLVEGFDNGLPTSASSSEARVNLSSGVWTVKGVAAKKDNGDLRATMSVSGRCDHHVGRYHHLLLTGNYWWLFGLQITHAADNGIKLEGSHNRIERDGVRYNAMGRKM